MSKTLLQTIIVILLVNTLYNMYLIYEYDTMNVMLQKVNDDLFDTISLYCR